MMSCCQYHRPPIRFRLLLGTLLLGVSRFFVEFEKRASWFAMLESRRISPTTEVSMRRPSISVRPRPCRRRLGPGRYPRRQRRPPLVRRAAYSVV